MAKTLVFSMIVIVCVVTPARAADVNGDRIETILFPFAFVAPNQEIPGARGTVWTGEVWFENRNRDAVRVWAECYVYPICLGSSLWNEYPSRVFSPLEFKIDPQVGFRFGVGVVQARNLTFSSRILERTLRTQPRGVDIPVIREGAFFSGPQTFLSVPAGTGVRTSLRVYDPWVGIRSAPGPSLEKLIVQIRGPAGPPLGELELRPVMAGATGRLEDSNRVGFAAIYDLAAIFPGVLTEERIHVTVRPVPDGAQYWGMVAVTDNETQTVAIVTAQ